MSIYLVRLRGEKESKLNIGSIQRDLDLNLRHRIGLIMEINIDSFKSYQFFEVVSTLRISPGLLTERLDGQV